MIELKLRTDGTLVYVEAYQDGLPEMKDEIVLTFEDIENLEDLENIVLDDGTIITVEMLNNAFEENDIEPADGPDGGTESGGISEYQDDAGETIDGLDKLNGLDPRDFQSIIVEALDADPLDEVLTEIPTIGPPEDPEIISILTLTNHKLNAGYNNSFGYYIKDENGNPVECVILWDNVKSLLEDTVEIEGYEPEDIGFFIIPDGDRFNKWLDPYTQVEFEQVDGQWTAFVDGVKVVGKDANILFDNPEFNANNYDYLVDNANKGNLNWEDIGGGDKDFNDVNITAEWAVLVDGVPQEFV